MDCPNCHNENPEGAKFCFNCGTKLILVCPQCETENPLQARFCFNCGHPFNEQWSLKKDEERPKQAVECALRLAKRARNAGTRLCLPEALLVQGKALAKAGEYEDAREVLAEAAAISGEIGQPRTLWQILAVMAKVELAQGNGDDASAFRGRAREIADYIAGRIGNEELQASFLSRPEVRALSAG